MGIKAILEAVLFVAERPLGPSELSPLLPEFSHEEIKTTLKILKYDYENEGRGLEVKEVAGGYRLQTREDLKDWILRLKRFARPRLSQASMETLAIIAYKQPVTRAEIEALRGVDSTGTIRFLLDKRLIRIAGRKETPGRPILYGTTRQFLETFELKDLSSLPSLSELEEMNPDLASTVKEKITTE
jgi:segregation and condensation protein B